MISIESNGSFQKTRKWLERLSSGQAFKSLERYGEIGARALSSATPVDSGGTAAAWSYQITKSRGLYEIAWTNSNVVAGTPVVILLQYGHGTGTGGYVQGRDFINPEIRPIFDQIAAEVWKEVTSA